MDWMNCGYEGGGRGMTVDDHCMCGVNVCKWDESQNRQALITLYNP